MPFSIQYLEVRRSKSFKSISKDKKKLIAKSIKEKLTQDPVAFGKPLSGNLKKHFRLRVEDYRVIYRIEKKAKIVVIVAIGHRKDIYDEV